MKRSSLAAVTAIAVLGAAWMGRAGEFEDALTLRASQVLPPALLKGPHHAMSDEVPVEAGYQMFRLTSDYGPMEAAGRTMLRVRLAEVDALARLSEVSKTDIFAQAAGGAVLHVGKGLAHVVADPGGTVKGFGRGASGSASSWAARPSGRRRRSPTMRSPPLPPPPNRKPPTRRAVSWV